MTRFLDIIASLLGLVLLSPLFLIVAIWIKLDDRKGPVFYRQTRVGKGGVDFQLYKFRSMYVDADKKGLITVGGRDPRITRSGYYIRKYKLDELPQLINILKGDMSVVGPRPEVRKYVDMYTEEQRRVLEVRPGLSDYASIEYLDENALLALSPDPDKTYVEEIMPAKIRLNMRYINKPTLKHYLNIILITFMGISVSRLFDWYFTRRSLSFWSVVLLDFSIGMVACLIAFRFVNGAEDLKNHFWFIVYSISVYLPLFLITGKIFRTFDLQLRMTTIKDLQKVGSSMFTGTCGIFIMRSFIPFEKFIWPIDSVTVLLGALLSTLLIMLVRIVIKSIHDSQLTKVGLPRAVIYGVSKNLDVLAQSLQNQPDQKFKIYAFLTPERWQSRHRLWGKKVYHKHEGIVEKLLEHHVSILVCGPIMSKKILQDREFVNQLTDAGIKICLTPDLADLVVNARGAGNAIKLKSLDIEDLLPREQIYVDMEAIGNLLKDQTIMITGAGGSIGGEMVRQIAPYKPKMMLLIDSAETPLHQIYLMMNREFPGQPFLALVTSITKERQMNNIFKTHRPDYVFHAAAYKHVPMMEISPANAIQNNCKGTRVIADLSVKYGVKKFVMISTDKAVNPTNVMGCSKRICEIYCQALNKYVNGDDNRNGNDNVNVNGNLNVNVEKVKTQFVTTRFGNVLGSNGSVIPIFKEQIKRGGPITVTHPDIVRYFMLIPEACKLVLQAGAMGHGGEIYVFDMGESVRIVDLARRMIEMSGAKGIEIVYTGLRDGEKLYEEVLSDAETMLPTQHPKIKVAKVREYDFEEVERNEHELEELSFGYDEMSIVRKMKEIVPEYRSNHSRFEVLDEKPAVSA